MLGRAHRPVKLFGAIGYRYFFPTKSVRTNQRLSAVSPKTCYCDDLASKGLPVVPIHLEGVAAVGAGTDPASWLASSPNTNAAKVFLNWVLSREGQIQFQKLTHENSLRVDIPKEGIVHPYYILDPKREYLFTGLEEYKDKINEFRPWLESLVTKK